MLMEFCKSTWTYSLRKTETIRVFICLFWLKCAMFNYCQPITIRLVRCEVKKCNFRSDAEKPDYLLFEGFLLMSYLLSRGTLCQYTIMSILL